jgi:hypothetical protein
MNVQNILNAQNKGRFQPMATNPTREMVAIHVSCERHMVTIGKAVSVKLKFSARGTSSYLEW